jgi:hypothetical protein
MSKSELDPTKLLKVPIDKICVNGYNPKVENTREYRKIKKSINLKGLRGAIVVRDHPHQNGYYEIIDGQQRYTAARELGYSEIWIYNEGDVEDQEAKELTIWYQQQVPFQKVTESYLVSSMVDEYGIENLELPYNSFELSQFDTISNLDFEDTKDIKENKDGTLTFTVKLAKTDYRILTDALTKAKQLAETTEDAEALTLIAVDYIISKQDKE